MNYINPANVSMLYEGLEKIKMKFTWIEIIELTFVHTLVCVYVRYLYIHIYIFWSLIAISFKCSLQARKRER